MPSRRAVVALRRARLSRTGLRSTPSAPIRACRRHFGQIAACEYPATRLARDVVHAQFSFATYLGATADSSARPAPLRNQARVKHAVGAAELARDRPAEKTHACERRPSLAAATIPRRPSSVLHRPHLVVRQSVGLSRIPSCSGVRRSVSRTSELSRVSSASPMVSSPKLFRLPCWRPLRDSPSEAYSIWPSEGQREIPRGQVGGKREGEWGGGVEKRMPPYGRARNFRFS